MKTAFWVLVVAGSFFVAACGINTREASTSTQPLVFLDKASCEADGTRLWLPSYVLCFQRPRTMSKAVCESYAPIFFWDGDACRPIGPDAVLVLLPLQ